MCAFLCICVCETVFLHSKQATACICVRAIHIIEMNTTRCPYKYHYIPFRSEMQSVHIDCHSVHINVCFMHCRVEHIGTK